MHPRDSWEVMACTGQDSWCSCLKQAAYPDPGSRFRPRMDPDQRAQGGVQITQPYMCKLKKTRSSGGWRSRGLKNGESLGEYKVF